MTACIVLYASYTAILVASLSITAVEPPFNTLEEMVKQSDYSYGMEEGSVTHLLLKVGRHFDNIPILYVIDVLTL